MDDTRRLWLLSALRAHTNAPYKTDLHRKTLMALNRPRGGADSGLREGESGLPSDHMPKEALQ